MDAGPILESLADPVVAFDRDWRYTYASRCAASAFGKRPEEMIGAPVEELGPGFREACQRALEAREPLTVEVLSKPLGGWVECRISPLENGAVVQWRKSPQAARRLAEIEAIYEFAPIGLCVLDAAGRFVRVNRRFAEMNGYSAEAHIGRTPGELNPDLRAAAEEGLRRVFQRGEPLLNLEVRGTTAAQPGVERIWNEHWVPLGDERGAVIGVSIAAEEITARKRAEEQVRAGEERFRRLVEVTRQVAWVVGAHGEALGDSPSWSVRSGRPLAEWPGWDWLDSVHPEDRARVEEAWRRAVETRGRYRVGFRQRHASGEYRYMEGQAAPVMNPDGTVREWVGMNTDVTELKRAERELAAAIQRLEAHMDNSPLAVVEFDPEFRVTRWSKGAERVFGWRAEEILGRSILQLRWVHPDDSEQVARLSADMVSGKRSRNVHANRNYRRDGSAIECEWYNSAIYDAEGRLASVLSLALDVTDRKRTEERLRQAQKTESIALLAGGLAHDFNNLMVGVIGNAGLAMEMLPRGSAIQELLERIISSGEQAAHLTRQMLAYSGKGQFVVEPVDLSSVVEEAAGQLRSTVSREIAIELNREPGLPPIMADRGQIHQAAVELAINAAEAIGSRPGTVWIETATRRLERAALEDDGPELPPGRYVSLEVRDTGCGMDQPTRAKIFDPFFTTKRKGRGLGLPAVAGIVRAHKGGLRVHSAPGRGTSFLLLFPASEVPPAREKKEAQPGLRLRGAVLVVDDEEAVRQTVAMVLERRGCRVVAAASGPEAIAACERDPEQFTLVLLDLSMPGMSGPEVLPRLLQINPRLDVLISSGYTEEETTRLFRGMRVAGFIQKPYTPQRLVEKIEAFVERRGT